MTATVEPEKILKDLRNLWVDLGREQEEAGGVLRACSMTLLVVADGDHDAEEVRRTLGVLMHNHPSRAIVLHSKPGATVEARVFAECWMPYGGNQQICSEGIEITADTGHLSEVARFLVPLIVPDLPVMLWCRGQNAIASGVFEPLFPLVGKIIFDSTEAPEPHTARAALKALRARGLLVADLAWTRLTGWRHVIANVFEDASVKIATVDSAKIDCSGAPSSGVLYFASWIRQAVPSARVTIEPGEGDPGLRSVKLSGGGSDVEIRLTAGSLIEVHGRATHCCSPLPPATDDAVMREELSIFGDDAVFDRVILAQD